ncbi:hypothetical protein ACHAQJ_006113 [Trichoderma viride]
MRVSLPVDPRNRTRGEITRLRFLGRATDVPVPEVIAFDDSASNEIGFEWVLMERMLGDLAYKRWQKMTIFQKVTLVQRMAELQAQISRHEFSRTGTLTVDSEEGNQEENHFGYDIAPLENAEDKEDDEGEEDKDDINFALALARRLISLLPKIFPSLQNPPERTVLWHENSSLSNILVDEQGKITAVIDWKCVSAMPRWAATQTPKFLEGPSSEEEPIREEYLDESPTRSEVSEADQDGELDNEGKTKYFWIDLMEYEKAQLRKFYHARMCQLQPDWDATVRESTLKEDFLNAVVRLGGGFSLKRIAQWVDTVEKGEFPRLMDIVQARL